jgi:hypothetical protein
MNVFPKFGLMIGMRCQPIICSMSQTYPVRTIYQYRLFAQDEFESNGNQSYNESNILSKSKY